MYTETLDAIAEMSAKKVHYQRRCPWGYLLAAMLAGAYVGVGVFLAFIVGAPMAETGSPWQRIVMGGSFAIALSLVVFAGGELFTGNNMTLAIGCWARKHSPLHLWKLWGLSWFGNLIGAFILAALLFYSSVLNSGGELALVQHVAEKKMQLTPLELLTRAIICNWLVCLGVWCGYRMKSESGKLIMIFWCLYAFVAAGFEHSVANMTLLSLALLQPHTAAVSLPGMGYNLLWVTLGNIIGGALFVGGAYWLANPRMTAACETTAHTPIETP